MEINQRLKTEMKNKILFGFALGIFILYNFVNLNVNTVVPFSPDESGAIFISELIYTESSFFWESDLNKIYNVSFFRPRGLVEVSSNKYTSFGSIGFAFFLAVFKGFNLDSVIISVTAMVLIFAIYLLGKEITDKKVALIAAMLFSIFPSTLIFANRFFDIIPSMSFYIFSIFYLFKFLRTNDISSILLSTIFFSFSIFLRPQNGMLIIPSIIVLFVGFKEKSFRRIINYSLLLTFFLLILLLINKKVYGGFFEIGQTVIGGASTSSRLISFPVIPSSLIESSKRYIIDYLNLFGISLIGLLGLLLVKKKDIKLKLYRIHFLTTVSVLIFFYGSRNGVYAFNSLSPAGSLARYYLPIYLGLFLFASYFLINFPNKLNYNFMKIFFAFLISLNMVMFTFSPNVNDSLSGISNNYRWAEEINKKVNTTQKDSVFFTKRYDKFIFPDRIVAIIFTEIDNEDYAMLYPILNVETDVLLIIEKLFEKGIKIYVVEDVPELLKKLKENEYKLVKLKDTEIFEVRARAEGQIS
jgi:hypothetical protein